MAEDSKSKETNSEPLAKPDTLELAFVAARAADDKQATNTIVLAVGNVLTITELFVVTGASNPRLVRAVAGEIEDRIREVCGRSPGAGRRAGKCHSGAVQRRRTMAWG